MKRQVDAAVVCEKYRKLAPQIIHSEAEAHTFPKFYRNKTLTIGVENSAWAEEVQKQKKSLIEGLNRLLDSNAVEKIQTKVVSPYKETAGF